MATQLRTKDSRLDELKDQLAPLGYSVREWAADAGLPWQRVYKRLQKPSDTRFGEYDKLLRSLERLKKKPKKCRG